MKDPSKRHAFSVGYTSLYRHISAEVSENKNKAGHNSTCGTVSSLLFFPLKVLLHTVYIFNIFMWTKVISSRHI
jgi:hypothetical protein